MHKMDFLYISIRPVIFGVFQEIFPQKTAPPGGQKCRQGGQKICFLHNAGAREVVLQHLRIAPAILRNIARRAVLAHAHAMAVAVGGNNPRPVCAVIAPADEVGAIHAPAVLVEPARR